jgi:hypothetical protein
MDVLLAKPIEPIIDQFFYPFPLFYNLFSLKKNRQKVATPPTT